jgi:hypothetical protein
MEEKPKNYIPLSGPQSADGINTGPQSYDSNIEKKELQQSLYKKPDPEEKNAGTPATKPPEKP